MSRTIALMTGGGDCPGLNAAIRTVTRVAVQEYGYEVIGIEDGYEGLIERRFRKLSPNDVRGILRIGGTILGSSNRTNPFKYVPRGANEPFDASDLAYSTLQEMGADGLIVIGGDGTLYLTHKFAGGRFPVVGIPKTIDNDVHGTDFAIGFDSCIATVSDAIDKLHTTAESHHRVLLVEVMGRTAGWVGLYAGVAGGADIVLIPERGYSLEGIIGKIEERREANRSFTIAVVAEGISEPGGQQVFRSESGDRHSWKLGGVCDRLARALGELTDREIRTIVLGHLQRGGSPTATDRILATQLAYTATEAIHNGKDGVMAGVDGSRTALVPLDEVAAGPRQVPDDHPLLGAAEAMGMYLG